MRALNYPRTIKPELIEIGDDIEATMPVSKGLTMRMRGIVARIEYHGATRYLSTAEDGLILAWEPGRKNVKCVLHDRPVKDQPTLFDTDLLDDVKERIA